MPQILAWKCPETGKLFEDQKKYKNHLAILARARRKVKHEKHIKSTFFEWLDDERTNKILDVADVPQWLMDNQQTIMDAVNAIPGRWDSFNHKFANGDLFTKILFSDVRWSPNQSNSHSCPRGGVTNWGTRETFADGTPKPTGYPGWAGRVDGTLKRLKEHNSNYPASGFFKLVGIHTGTGGCMYAN